MKKWLTVPEVCAHLSFSRAYVYELVGSGKFTILRPEQGVGKKGLRILAESVKNYESACTTIAL